MPAAARCASSDRDLFRLLPQLRLGNHAVLDRCQEGFLSTPFKTLPIVLGLLFGWLTRRSVLARGAGYAAVDAREAPSASAYAAASLLCWTVASISGRLLGYSTYGDSRGRRICPAVSHVPFLISTY